MRILVTGGAGFIGANFLFYQRQTHPEDELICLDKLTYAGDMDTLAPLLRAGELDFVRGDIADREAVYALFARTRPQAVVNFAAETHVDRSIREPEVFLRSNVLGTQVLLDACREYGVGRFHQVSTDEVYGDLPLDTNSPPFTETSPLRPSSPYSASKAGADLLALAYHRTYGLGVSVSRCTNNYGPYQFPEKLIPLMLVNALSGRPLPVYGQGRNVRDWLYVRDHCAAVDAVLRRGRVGQVYNVGGRCERENLQVVRAVAEKLGRGEITFVPDRAGHDLRYALDASKLEEELGWRPETAFGDGLERTIRWYLDNRPWWERILSGEYQKNMDWPADGR